MPFFKRKSVTPPPPRVEVWCSSIGDNDGAKHTAIAHQINELFAELHKLPGFPHRSLIIDDAIIHLPSPKAKK